MKKVISIILITMILFGNIASAKTEAHVIYDTNWISDHTVNISLKWSDATVDTPISIASWVTTEKELIVFYQIGDKAVKEYNNRTIASESINLETYILLRENGTDSNIKKFTDMPENEEYKRSIKELFDRGVINGYADGSFKPNGTVKRSEFCKMLVEALNLQTKNSSEKTEFSDITNHWAKKYIEILIEKEVLNGYADGTFKPEGNLKVSEVFKILDKTFEIKGKDIAYSRKLSEHWSNENFLSLVDKGIIKPTDDYYIEYSPEKKATRVECAMFLTRVLHTYH